MSDQQLKQTPLHAMHVRLGGKMVPFAGYDMPVQYPLGVKGEHLHTRAKAGLFDVSHMGQVRIDGADAAANIEKLVTGDIQGLGPGEMRYTLFTDENGGILDDLIVTNAGDHLFVVVNAGCKDADTARMVAAMGDAVTPLDDRALLALQGPSAMRIMAELAPGAEKLLFMTSGTFDVAGIPAFVTRSGYTGEDGYEISVMNDQAEVLAEKLLADEDVEFIGLGARDSLRLEAGLCLYGHDINETTNPVEASLLWAVPKSRRAQADFPGAEKILQMIEDGAGRKRVGLRPEGKAPVREGAELVTDDGTVIGTVTSGGFGPSIEGPVAMGYVSKEFSAVDTRINAVVRGKQLPVQIQKMPFVTANYYRG